MSSRPRRHEEAEGEEAAEEEEAEGGDLVEVAQPKAVGDPHVRAGRPHRRSGAHVSARDGLGRASVARRRNRHRQAHRGRPRGDDRRALRKPADLPGDHHLARRIERQQGAAARHHRSRGDLCRPRRQEHAEDRHDGAGRRRSRSPRSSRARDGAAAIRRARLRPAGEEGARAAGSRGRLRRRGRHGEFRVALGDGSPN